MESLSTKKFLQSFLWASILLSILAAFQTVQQVNALEIVLWRSKWIFLLGIFALNVIVGFFVLFSALLEGISFELDRFADALPIRRFRKPAGVFLVVFGFSLVWVARLIFFGRFLPQLMPILWLFLWASLIQVLGLRLLTGFQLSALFFAVALFQGVIYQMYGRIADVSDFPFSIGYSEASRHYYASLFHSKSIYDIQLPYPFLHPSRYLLMSLPFWVEGLPLWFHRFWQSLLWLVLTLTSAVLLVRRMHLRSWMYYLAAAWAFLYFFQGAVYYHLHVCIILILAGVSVKNPRRSFVVVVLASLWAGISRVNWFPVPAMLGIAIYIMETSLVGRGWRYWGYPFLLGVVGIGAALASQFIYINLAGNADARAFGSSFTSALLWDRLLPNDTYPLGILLGIMIVSAPLGIALYQMLSGKLAKMHLLRWGALVGLLLVLFAGGLVVSTKIGGGGDLHNMDAFLVMLALITTSFFSGRVIDEKESIVRWGNVQWGVAALLVPLGFALPQMGSFYSYDHAKAEKDVQRLQQIVTEAVEGGGEVLFVTERQLLTFGELQNIPLISEYEQVELMEMAMSGNRDYLEQYYSDLDNRRFALIIAEEQKYNAQSSGAFHEEDVAWVRYIGAPLLCAYKPLENLSTNNLQVFVPRPGHPVCKDPFAE